MQELVRLRQQQQATDHQLQTMGQRLQGMEQRQQQMMSFLAKAMQSPGFLAQLVQQQNDSNRCISGVSKKRRLPKQEENSEGECAVAPDGQIVKYQPLMSEAAKSMLRQILKFDASPRLESSNGNPDSFMIDDIPTPSNSLDGSFDGGGSSSRTSGVTLSEVPPTSGQSLLPVASGFPGSRPSAAISEIQSSSGLVTDMVSTTEFPDLSVLSGVEEGGAVASCQTDMVLPDLPQVHGLVGETNIVDIPAVSYVETETCNGAYIDPLPDSELLPSINDVFWEQFLNVSPLSGDPEEIDSSIPEGIVKEKKENSGEENGWDKAEHMDQLTEQMGLLTSDTKAG